MKHDLLFAAYSYFTFAGYFYRKGNGGFRGGMA